VILYKLPEQKDLPPGDVWLCLSCGTRVKVGQVHTSARPVPHQTLYPILAKEDR
jgi:hypothetical protein